jgi:hypothetical protein
MLQPKQTPKEKKNIKDATKMKNMRPVFKGPGSKLPQPKPSYVGGSPAKNGKTMKKAKSGTSLGMKSVKAGYDNNPSVTRADIITAAKGKAKSGASMKKCKYGCK